MSQSGFEMFSNVAGMVIVIADVIFFYALWNIFCKNKKEKMSMMIGSVLLLLNIGLGFISSLPTSGRLIISAIAILTYSIVRYKKHCEKPVFILATVYKGNIIKNLIMDCQSYTKYRPNETTGGIFVSWRRKEELPTGA